MSEFKKDTVFTLVTSQSQWPPGESSPVRLVGRPQFNFRMAPMIISELDHRLKHLTIFQVSIITSLAWSMSPLLYRNTSSTWHVKKALKGHFQIKSAAKSWSEELTDSMTDTQYLEVRTYLENKEISWLDSRSMWEALHQLGAAHILCRARAQC
jgi:hypothetical protein